jgi:hypothetical protein
MRGCCAPPAALLASSSAPRRAGRRATVRTFAVDYPKPDLDTENYRCGRRVTPCCGGCGGAPGAATGRRPR